MDEKEPKRILVVDDEAVYQRVFQDGLSKAGFAIITAEDGERGLEVALERKPDLIILDLDMPKIDGMDMLHKLRASGEWGKTVPVFILTSLPSSDEQRMRDVAKLEPTYYLDKATVAMDELVTKIQERISG